LNDRFACATNVIAPPFTVDPGEGHCDFRVPRWPVTAGRYRVKAPTWASAWVEPSPEGQPGYWLTDAAAEKAKGLLEQEGRDDLALRVAVQPGGCSGLRYQLFFDERTLDGDVVTDFDGVAVVVDRMSVPYLNGALIDFVDSIEKQGFTIDNPNATGSCACGDSFN
jgi:iron-sulfur cluster assembly accessory protein